MIKALLIILIMLINTLKVLSQTKIDGVYSGKIFTENNIFIISSTGSRLKGNIYLDRSKKYNFTGSISNGRLIGKIVSINPEEWDVRGSKLGDSLLLLITGLSKKNNIVSTLKRISSKTRMSHDKYLLTVQTHDPWLIGDWILVKEFNRDGTEKATSAEVKGMHNKFIADGSLSISSPAMEKVFNSLDVKKRPTYNWSTNNSILTVVGSEFSSGQKYYSEKKYKITGDTIYFTAPNGVVSIFIKIRR